jgi:hypothetical protein
MMMTSRLSRSFRTPGRVAANEFPFERARCVSVRCASKTSSAGSQKVYADSPAPKVRKNPFKYSSTLVSRETIRHTHGNPVNARQTRETGALSSRQT